MPASDPFPVLCLLQSHLEALAGRGQRRMWLNAEARQALREIVRMKPRPWTLEMAAAASAAAGSAASGSVEKAEAEVAPETPADGVARAKPEAGLADVTSENRPPEAAVPVSAAEQELSPGQVKNELDFPGNEFPESVLSEDGASWNDAGDESDDDGTLAGMTEEPVSSTAREAASRPLTLAEKEARLAAVRERAEEGSAARALGTLRSRMVFAVGRADAEIVFVGEAPGAEEERLGEPFVGPAGQLLNRILNAMGLQRGEVYISNICKFRPEMENQGSRNRQPSGLEMAACMDFVREEIRIIQPRVIVALGATAAAGLLGIKSGVMSARGRFYEFEDIPAMVTLHPSYLLHREKDGPDIANAEKRKVWEDMLQVMERAGLPVSEKQRRFFLPR